MGHPHKTGKTTHKLRSQLGLVGGLSRRSQEGGPRDALRCQNCRMSHAFSPLLPPSFFLVFYNGFCTVRENKVSHFNKNGKNAWDIRTFWTCSFSLLCTSVFLSLFHALPPLSFTFSPSTKTAKTLGTFEQNVPPCLQSPPRPST